MRVICINRKEFQGVRRYIGVEISLWAIKTAKALMNQATRAPN
jgi:hypothetical protein